MAQWLQNNVFLELDYESCLQFARKMDIDKNEVITDEDLQAFLLRYSYFEQRKNLSTMDNIFASIYRNSKTGSQFEDALTMVESSVVNAKSVDLLTLGQKKTFQNLVDGMKDNQQATLFPIEPLSEDKFDRILKDLRYKLQLKGMNYEELFALLDSNHNGFLTITEFSQNIEKIMHLSQPAKDGFFAFMDKQRIGLVDLNTFLKYVGKSIVQKMAPVEEDDFDWELEILFKIRNWVNRENLTVEDAFRTFDKDYDGEISKADIHTYLLDILKIEHKEITQAKVNRIFKLMDQFKRGKITLVDFKRFIQEGVFYGQNTSIFGNPTNLDPAAKTQQQIRSSFDWKVNARQQMGLVISRHFPGCKQSFDMISGYRKKMVF